MKMASGAMIKNIDSWNQSISIYFGDSYPLCDMAILILIFFFDFFDGNLIVICDNIGSVNGEI